MLIIADSSENLHMLGALLRTHYRVSVTSLSVTAWRQASSQPRPDLILLDVMLSGTEAHAALAGLHENPQTADIPVVYLTTATTPADETHARALGVADYITKPVMFLSLLARVRTHLEARFAQYRINCALSHKAEPRAAAPSAHRQQTPRRRSHERS